MNIERQHSLGSRADTVVSGWFGTKDTTTFVEAIAREKELKKWRRSWKLYLIEGFNAEWNDLFETCYERDNPSDTIRARTGQASGGGALDSGFRCAAPE